MQVPDCLSRAPYNVENPTFEIMVYVDEVIAPNFVPPDFSKTTDDYYKELREKIVEYPNGYPLFAIKDDLIYKKIIDPVSQKAHIVYLVPADFRTEIITQYHSSLMSAHLGFRKTLGKISKTYYWTGMQNDIKYFINHCKDCQQSGWI